MTISWIVLLSLLSGLLYRLGGWGQPGRDKFPWLPGWVFDTKARDIGCGLCTISAWFILGMHNNANVLPWVKWWHILIACVVTVLCMLGALSTYWDWLFDDEDNFYMHGFMCGVAAFPLVILSGAWILFAVRCAMLSILMGVWSALIGKDWIEEGGRGISLPVTMAIFRINL